MPKAKKTKNDLTAGLTLLGSKVTEPVRQLETFPNTHPGRRYTVTLVCPEFTCVCPMTGQPDFATITIRYIPDQKIVEFEVAQAVPVVVPRGRRLSRTRRQPDSG